MEEISIVRRRSRIVPILLALLVIALLVVAALYAVGTGALNLGAASGTELHVSTGGMGHGLA